MLCSKKGFRKIKKNIDSFVNYFQVMLLTGVWFLCFFVLFACLLVWHFYGKKLSICLQPKINPLMPDVH